MLKQCYQPCTNTNTYWYTNTYTSGAYENKVVHINTYTSWCMQYICKLEHKIPTLTNCCINTYTENSVNKLVQYY